MRKGLSRLIVNDEQVRPDASIEALSQLRPAFTDGGSITAGNASPLSDGAAALILTTRANAERLNHPDVHPVVRRQPDHRLDRPHHGTVRLELPHPPPQRIQRTRRTASTEKVRGLCLIANSRRHFSLLLRLTRAVGKAKAMEMILTARVIDADEAERIRLVARVAP